MLIVRSHGQRRLALVGLLAAAGLAVASFPFRATWWGGWILAIAEAGIVGGLADWFAVTALFRHPLGVPIPHTALIPANWELMAKRVGAMVGDRVLTKEYVTQEISRLDLVDFLARAAEHVTRADLESATRSVARWLAEQVPPEAAGELLTRLQGFLARYPVTPVLAATLEAACKHGWDQRVITALVWALDDALDRPEFRESVGELVDDLLARYRQQMGTYRGAWIGLADFLGLIDRDRIVTALRAGLQEVAQDRAHPLRQQLAETLAELPVRLGADAELAARIEAVKQDLLGSPVVRQLLEDVATEIRRALAADLHSVDSGTVAWVTDRLERARQAVVMDVSLRRALDGWIKGRVIELVERYHGRVAAFIERGVHVLGPEGAVRLIEEHAGEDLQFIRVNGTVVGGLVGGGLYGIHLLLRGL